MVYMQYRADFLRVITKETDCLVYTIKFSCTTHTDDINNYKCVFADLPEHAQGIPYSVNMMRIFLYKWWATNYHEDAKILLSDFRDVVFQSNPFNYMPSSWNNYPLVIFHEQYPNNMIYRSMFNKGWLQKCYGNEAYEKIAYNVVSCSGTVLGSRNGILAYVSMN